MLAPAATDLSAQQPSPAEELIRQERVRQEVEDAFALYRQPEENGDVQNDNLVEAVEQLVRLGADAVPFLTLELEQAHPGSFFFSAYALGRIGGAEAEKALRDAVESAERKPTDWAALRKGLACYALGLMGVVDAVDLVNSGRHQSGNAPIHGSFSVLEAIALFNAPESGDRLVVQFDRYDDEGDPLYSDRANVVKALGRVPSQAAFKKLQAILKNEHPRLRRQAAFSLASSDTAETISALLAALDDPDVLVRRAAARALNDSLPIGRLEVPLAKLQTEEQPVLRGALYGLIARAGGPAMTEVLVAQWGHPDPLDRSQLVRVFPDLDIERTLPVLREALSDPVSRVYVATATALGEIGSETSVELLIESLRSPYWTLAQTALEQLRRLDETRAAKTILDRLIDIELAGVVSDPRRRSQIEQLGETLVALRGTGRLDDLREAASRQKDALLIRYLDRQIKRLETIRANENKTKLWIASVASPDADIRMLAYDALGRAATEQAARALVDTFPRVEPDEGVAILRALGKIDSAPSRQLIERILTAPEFDPIERAPLRDMAAWSARRIGGKEMVRVLEAGVERRQGRDIRPLIYLAVLGGDESIPFLDRYRIPRMRYIKWSRGAELERLDWIRRELTHGRTIDDVDVPPGKLKF
jgi:HEAT repeat protein